MYKRFYFQNVCYCGQCNGDGCKHCKGTGIQSISTYLLDRPFSDPIAMGVFYRRALVELLTNNF